MIDISRYINSETVVVDLEASSRDEAIRLLLENIYSRKAPKEPRVPKEKAYEAVIKRENLQSTGIGNELAFPHARIEGWGEFALAMGFVRDGVDFKSMDGRPARFVFLMISSTEEPYMILQAMSAIIRFLGNMGHTGGIMESPLSIEEVLERIQRQEIKATEQILARDIARPVADFVTLEMPIEEVTRKMHLDRLSVLPIVREDGTFFGELTCYDIFMFGMPDFFKQLKTISFVRHIDPFEKYFSIRKGLKVRDMNPREEKGLSKDSTLLEIIFEMSVKKRSKLFMVEENGALAGVIDRFCVIDRILFF
ncbi:MAG: hypothetical protein GF408_05115 [Candidatus Omnitrophica bacterium]|nr:hypothetical protein [Candidatus Omnitrophota bacterium]